MDGLHQPLLSGGLLELEPELFHLLRCPFGQSTTVLNLLPKSVRRKVILGVLREDLKHHHAFANSESLLLADVQLFALAGAVREVL